MSRNRNFFSILISVLLLSLVLFCLESEATLSLDASPVRGGSSLRFGRVDSSKMASQEVRIRASSDEGNQYQIFQAMIEPFSNEKGEFLHASALQSYAITGSNAFGSLYNQQIANMKNADDLLYSSSPTGQSDSVTMVYTINPENINLSGRFSGKILYTMRPVSGGAQKQAYIDVFLEISEDFKIQTQASSGKSLVRLKTKSPVDVEGYLTISFSGNFGERVNVYQEIDRFPASELNEDIGKEAIRFSVTGSKDADIKYSTPSALSRRMLIYSSSLSSDELTVHYLLDEQALAKEKAAVYKGQIKYIVEKQGSFQTILLDVEVVVDPVFELLVSFPQGEPRFDNLLPNSPPQVREAVVEVKTNLGKPYAVVQKISSPLANEKGFVFKKDFFDMKVEDADGVGKNNFEQFEPVPQEEQVIFTSDLKGNSCKARVYYRLRPYPQMDPGNYLTSIVYSLGEM